MPGPQPPQVSLGVTRPDLQGQRRSVPPEQLESSVFFRTFLMIWLGWMSTFSWGPSIWFPPHTPCRLKTVADVEKTYAWMPKISRARLDMKSWGCICLSDCQHWLNWLVSGTTTSDGPAFAILWCSTSLPRLATAFPRWGCPAANDRCEFWRSGSLKGKPFGDLHDHRSSPRFRCSCNRFFWAEKTCAHAGSVRLQPLLMVWWVCCWMSAD